MCERVRSHGSAVFICTHFTPVNKKTDCVHRRTSAAIRRYQCSCMTHHEKIKAVVGHVWSATEYLLLWAFVCGVYRRGDRVINRGHVMSTRTSNGFEMSDERRMYPPYVLGNNPGKSASSTAWSFCWLFLAYKHLPHLVINCRAKAGVFEQETHQTGLLFL